MGRKHPTGRRPFRREMPGRGQRNPEARRCADRKVGGSEEREGRPGKEMVPGGVPGRRAREMVNLRRALAPDPN